MIPIILTSIIFFLSYLKFGVKLFAHCFVNHVAQCLKLWVYFHVIFRIDFGIIINTKFMVVTSCVDF